MRPLAAAIAMIMAWCTSAPALNDNDCSAYASLAENVMNARQSGVSLEDSLRVGIVGTDPILRRQVRSMIMAAYEEPRYSTEAMQRRLVSDFRDRVHLECLKSIR